MTNNWGRFLRVRNALILLAIIGIVVAIVIARRPADTPQQASAEQKAAEQKKVVTLNYADGTVLSTLKPGDKQPLVGPRALIQQRVFDELEKNGLELGAVQRQGLTITTTIDPPAQALAEQTVAEQMRVQPAGLQAALVSVDPKTGGVRAYYGGDGDGFDYAAMGQHHPGSVFEAFDLVALLKRGKGLGETYDGTSGQTIFGRPWRNPENSSGCGKTCTVAEAIRQSTNTVFVNIAQETGTEALAKAARDAGIVDGKEPNKGGNILESHSDNIAVGGGTTVIHPLDLAGAFASFAADGVRHRAHFIHKVTDPAGATVLETPTAGEQAFDVNPARSSQIARNVTHALEPVLPSAKLSCGPGQFCAGKTGTHEMAAVPGENSHTWMAGYSATASTVVWIGNKEGEMPLRDGAGAIIWGRTLPGQIWQQFMTAYLSGKPAQPFGKYEPIGKPA